MLQRKCNPNLKIYQDSMHVCVCAHINSINFVKIYVKIINKILEKSDVPDKTKFMNRRERYLTKSNIYLS